MGISLQEVLADAGANDQVSVTVVTLQDDGLASYASGFLLFQPGSGSDTLGGTHRAPHLTTAGTNGLDLYRSDQIDFMPGSSDDSPTFVGKPQPFSVRQKVGMDISISAGVVTVLLVNNKTTITMESRGNFIVGIGQFVAPGAIWAISFNGIKRGL
jgi:hypothetical protein